MDADAQDHQNPFYHTQTSASSSTLTYFREQAIRAGFPSGNFGGDGHEGLRMSRGRFQMTEAIQRELEKERIRTEIIAEEMARRRILEEEVRNELKMEREMMAMRSGGGFSSPFMPLSMPPSHNNLFEPIILHRQPIGLEERIAMSLEERNARGDHPREIRGFEFTPFQRFGDSPKIIGIPTLLPEDTEKTVIVLGNPNGETSLPGTKRKSTPAVSEGSSEPLPDNGSKKKVKEEWSCAICQVSATSERALNEHLHGKKHQMKEADLIAQKTGANVGLGVAPKKPILKLALTTIDGSSSEKKSRGRKESVDETASRNKEGGDGRKGEEKKGKHKFWCEMCEVGAFSEKVMNNHKGGKKHLRRLVQVLRKGKMEGEAPATCDTEEEKSEGGTCKKAVVVGGEGEGEVKEDVSGVVEEDKTEIKDDMEDGKDASI